MDGKRAPPLGRSETLPMVYGEVLAKREVAALKDRRVVRRQVRLSVEIKQRKANIYGKRNHNLY